MDPDLSKITEIFLTPNSILVGALGVAGTERLKTGVSFLGLTSSVMWLVCSHDALPNPVPSTRVGVLAWLPLLFIAGWLISSAVHGWRWYKLLPDKPIEPIATPDPARNAGPGR